MMCQSEIRIGSSISRSFRKRTNIHLAADSEYVSE